MTTTQGNALRHLRELVAAEHAGRLSDQELLQRFTARHEGAAFEELVRRHGPLVLGVCRRVLHNGHDAEDAFQATFLVLARKASSIRKRDALASWLHGVAYRTAVKARTRAANRQRHERQAGAPAPADPLAEVTGRELLSVIDEELHGLPDCYREPLVLCYLEGKTCDDAARRLGWAVRTLKRRLAEGRERLRVRLTRRGLALPAALLAAGLAQSATAAVPAPLAAATVRAALAGAAGGAIAVHVEALAEEVARTMSASKLKTAAACLLAVGLFVLGAAALDSPAQAPRPPAEPPRAEETAPPKETARPAEGARITVVGRVAAPDGKPVAGAQVAAILYRSLGVSLEEPKVAGRAETDREGRYQLDLPGLPPGEPFYVHVRAIAKGYGLGALFVDSTHPPREETLALVPEVVARCRLITIEGAPAGRVKFHVLLPNYGNIPEGEPWSDPLTTDEQGRFTLRGLGEGTRVTLEVHDDRFARQRLSLEVRAGKQEKESTFTLAPLRLVEGKVTEQDTGKPVANARVIVDAYATNGGTGGTVEGRTDEQGRYRIIPYSANNLAARFYPPSGSAYLPVQESFWWKGAAVKRELDLKLRRGVLLRGKVTEAGSGKPVAGAGVGYRPRRRDNPFGRDDILRYLIELQRVKSGPDGTFQLAVAPGPGHLLIKGPTPDYLHVETSYHELERGKPGGERLYPDGLVAVSLKPGAGPHDVTVTLRRGVTVRGSVLQPDGKPLAEGFLMSRSYLPWGFSFGHHYRLVKNGAFDLPGRDPEKAAPVFFLDARNQWGATVEVSGKQAGEGPVTVPLAPCGSVTVRFVDQHGKPWADQPVGDWPLMVHLFLILTPGETAWANPSGEPLQSDALMQRNLDDRRYNALRTDAAGRVTFPTLIPGATYHLMTGEGLGTVKKEFGVKSGQNLDLGNVTMGRRAE